MLHDIFGSLEETLFMVFTAGLFSFLFGFLIALGMIKIKRYEHRAPLYAHVYRGLSVIIETCSSLPYLVFLILLVPMLRTLFGTDSGMMAAVFALTFISIFPMAALCEKKMQEQEDKFHDLTISLGATPMQKIFKFYLKQAKPDLILGAGSILQQLLGYSIIAGLFGAGGFGRLLIEKGYQNFQWSYVIASLLFVILIIRGIQYGAFYFSSDH